MRYQEEHQSIKIQECEHSAGSYQHCLPTARLCRTLQRHFIMLRRDSTCCDHMVTSISCLLTGAITFSKKPAEEEHQVAGV